MDPLDTPLPCDVHIGHIIFRKGVRLRTLASAAERWLQIAKASRLEPTEEEKAEFRRILGDTQ